MPQGSEPDLIVVGAGAAGLGAATTARALGLSVAVLEAKDRVGGRAHTDTSTFGVPWDRGAAWLHNARRNPLARFADVLGFRCECTPARIRFWAGAWVDTAREMEIRDYYTRAFAAITAAGAAGRDVAAASVLPDPPQPHMRAMFDAWSAALSGVEPERMSTLDDFRYEAGSANWRVEEGYGALLVRCAAKVPVALSTPVARLRWGGRRIVAETAQGDLAARAAIVTVSTTALASGAIAFDPPLPERVQAALDAVPLGGANKVALQFEGNVFGGDEPFHLHFEHETLEAIRFEIRPFRRNLAIGYLGGRFAAELEAAGPQAMAAFAREQLAKVFGSAIMARLKRTASTGWCSDPHVRGGYSCARPGQAHLRPVLAEPVAQHLFLAGEACSHNAYGTVHGAWESGCRAARIAAKALRSKDCTAAKACAPDRGKQQRRLAVARRLG